MMEHVKTELSDGLLVITMARGKANPMNSRMVEELNTAVDEARRDEGVLAVVIASDREKFFSAGFDVTEVFAYDRETMTPFFGRFIDLYESLISLPKPVVAAVSGHAFAGGAVLALSADVRVMAEGGFGFALNEINLGIAVPPGMVRMAIRAVGPARASEMVLEGKTFTPAEALQSGLAAELAAPADVLARAVERARALAAKPPVTFGAVKRTLAEAAGLAGEGGDRKHLARFIDQWFSEESTRHRQALIDSLRR